jgi:AraC family transcriptional activator of pobA
MRMIGRLRMDRRGNRLHYWNMDGIPIYGLYGEQESSTDWLHWESIQSRSRPHGYRIAPHRHEQFFQVLVLTRGSGEVTLDGTDHPLLPSMVVVVPALTVHGYRFSEDVDGLVLTLMQHDIRAVDLPVPKAMVVAQHTRRLCAAARNLVDEARIAGPDHDAAMRALLTLLIIEIRRGRQDDGDDAKPDRAFAMVQRFRDLVEERFRDSRRIGGYAAALGISPTHLNRICRRVAGTTALRLIERRVGLEARRMLAFSTLSIKQIGSDLGYEDPAYFTRFVTRVLGAPPSAFRRDR